MTKAKHTKKKTKRVRKKRNLFSDIPIWTCIIFILLGAVLGSIFAYDCLYLGKSIDREDAIVATGVFESYKYLHGQKSGAVSEVQINFIDREALYLDAYHVEMDEKFESLKKGDRLDLLLHPNSEYIWEMTTEDEVILSFNDAKSRTQLEKGFFGVILVGFGFICASMGVTSLCVKYQEYKKAKNGKR